MGPQYIHGRTETPQCTLVDYDLRWRTQSRLGQKLVAYLKIPNNHQIQHTIHFNGQPSYCYSPTLPNSTQVGVTRLLVCHTPPPPPDKLLDQFQGTQEADFRFATLI